MTESRTGAGRRPLEPSAILSSIGRQADEAGVVAHLAGGAVRDRLRRRRVRDLDIAIEGDAVALARAWSKRAVGTFTKSSAFGTATVVLPGDSAIERVDFASTRAEEYDFPAALPRVRPAGISEDLARRDFTINAMAIALNGPARGRTLDPFGGHTDLSRRIVRMLHPRSPTDDPTRAFRAVRFAMRLDFRIETRTRRWIAEAVASGAFDRLSGDRLGREIFLLFSEQKPADAVRALASLGLVAAIAPGLRSGTAVFNRLRRVDSLARRGRLVRTTTPLARAAVLSWSLDVSENDRNFLARRLGLAGDAARELEVLGDRVRDARAESRKVRSSGLAAMSRSWSPASLLAVASALEPRDGARLVSAWSRASSVRLSIGGEDLKRRGATPGPAIGRALEETWRARVDRRIASADELAYALAELRK